MGLEGFLKQQNLNTMEGIEFDAVIKDVDETIAALTKVINSIKALNTTKIKQ